MPEERGLRTEREAGFAVRAGAARGKWVFLAAHEAGPAGGGVLAAGQVRGGGAGRGVETEVQRFRGEKAIRRCPGDLGGAVARAQLAQDEGPRQWGSALEPERLGTAHAWGAPGAQDETGFVESAATGAADHLQQLVRFDLVLQLVETVGRGRDEHGAQGEIDPRAETERSHHGAELSGLGQGLDHARALGVGETAVVVGHALPHELGQHRPEEILLLGRQHQGLGQRNFARELPGKPFGILPVGCKDQHRPQPLAQRPRHPPAPETLHRARQAVDEIVGINLLQWHRALAVLDELDRATEPLQPVHHFLGVGDAPAEKKKLHHRRQRQENPFVVVAAIGIGQPLVLVDHQQLERKARPRG